MQIIPKIIMATVMILWIVNAIKKYDQSIKSGIREMKRNQYRNTLIGEILGVAMYIGLLFWGGFYP